MSFQQRRKTFEGFKRAVNDWVMHIKMNLWIIKVCIVLQIILFLGSFFWRTIDCRPLGYWSQLIVSSILAEFPNNPLVTLDLGEGSHSYLAIDVRNWILDRILPIYSEVIRRLELTSGIYFIGLVAFFYFRRATTKNSEPKHLRGQRLISQKELIDEIREKKEPSQIKAGEIPIPFSYENHHSLILGATSTGKSTLLSSVYEQVNINGAKTFLYDFKGSFISQQYRPDRDYIFSPTDARSVPWCPFDDMESIIDMYSTGGSIFAEPPSEREPYWRLAPKDIFNALLFYLWQTGQRTNKAIWEAVTAPLEDIRRWLKVYSEGRAGLRHIEGNDGQVVPQINGVLSSLVQYARAFEFMTDIKGGFSISRWIKEGRNGTVFLGNPLAAQENVKGVLSLFIDMAGYTLASLPDDINRRIYFIIDEFGTLHRMNMVVDMLATVRSKGGSVWLASQDLGRIFQIYGENLTEALFNNCGNKFVFRIDSPKTLSFAERAFGDREILITEEGFTMGPQSGKDGITLGKKTKIEKVILGSEISALPNLHCFLKLAHHSPVKIKIPLKVFPEKNQGMILRENLKLKKRNIQPPDDTLSL